MRKIAFILTVFLTSSLASNAFIDNTYMTTEQFMVNTGYSSEMAKMMKVTNQDPYTISSTIPTGIEIKYYIDNFSLSNEQLFGYNSKDNSQVLITENPDINNGYITFISNGSESYILSNDAINSNQSTSTTLPNIIYIGIGIVIGFFGTLAALWFIKNIVFIIP